MYKLYYISVLVLCTIFFPKFLTITTSRRHSTLLCRQKFAVHHCRFTYINKSGCNSLPTMFWFNPDLQKLQPMHLSQECCLYQQCTNDLVTFQKCIQRHAAGHISLIFSILVFVFVVFVDDVDNITDADICQLLRHAQTQIASALNVFFVTQRKL